MTFLCQMGYARAVILQTKNINDNWTCVLFHHREPQITGPQGRHRLPTPWPERGQHVRTAKPTYVPDIAPDPDRPCILRTSFDLTDLNELPCPDFMSIPLDDVIKEQICKYEIKPVTCAVDLDQCDRLCVFTDGSSRPKMRRYAPDRADALGCADTWSMIVVGESVGPGDLPQLHLLGWTSQPARHDPCGSAYFGIDRLG